MTSSKLFSSSRSKIMIYFLLFNLMVSYFVILVKVTFRMKISKNLIRKMNGIFYYFSHRERREGGREEGIQKIASKWLKIGYVQVKSLYFNEFLFFLWRHKSYGFKNLVKLEGWETNFKITKGRTIFKKSCSNSSFTGMGALFFKKTCSKNYVQK